MDTSNFAKHLRKNQAPAEELIWEGVRNRRCGGYKFRRQARIDHYVVDFLCVAKKVIVEIDGLSHEGREDYDEARTKHLVMRGYHVIRFTNDDVYEDADAVIEAIYECLSNI
jgi:very-short-patch-repair endonuclease